MSMLADRDGAIWVGGDTLSSAGSEGRHRSFVARIGRDAGMGGIMALAASPHCTLWVGVGKAGLVWASSGWSTAVGRLFDTPAFLRELLGRHGTPRGS